MVRLSKEESVKRINLRKKSVINLTKDTPLENLTSRVALVLDFSGSMRESYINGDVQDIIERILPIAMKFDDNGELDFWIFDDDFHRLDGVTLNNFYGLTDRLMKEYNMGGTNYAPVIRDIKKYYISEEPLDIPSYVIFITDGDNVDKSKATDIIKIVSRYPIFFQFIGVGDKFCDFKFLKSLDEMEGRYVDNANFFQVDDIGDLSDVDLYKMLLAEYPQWLGYPEVTKMLEEIDTLSEQSKSDDAISERKKIKFPIREILDFFLDLLDLIF